MNKYSNFTTARELFNIDSDMEVPILNITNNSYIPRIDPSYKFNLETSLAILSGFIYNHRVLIHGHHGTGKSSHIEQIAARINWPCFRVNLDSYIARSDLIGRDIIKLVEGKQVTQFQYGIIPWAIEQTMAIILDEYDAARPDVLFTIQRLLENNGNLTLLEENKVIAPHHESRIFATCNTIGFGDTYGIYHGTNPINQGQIDRWNIVTHLTFPEPQQELEILLAKAPEYNNPEGIKLLQSMIALAGLIRTAFNHGDVSCLISIRTLINWLDNLKIFKDLIISFKFSFLNKCEYTEKTLITEYFQRCFDQEIHLI